MVVSKGYVSATISPEVEEGEETTERDAGGELLLSEQGDDEIKWWTLEIVFGRVDPDLVTLMMPSWQPIRDENGITIGFSGGGRLAVDGGFAVELWMDAKVEGEDACAGGGSGQWGYFLLPSMRGTAPGEITIENGLVSFTLNGRTRKGSRWGRGPYRVVNVDGVPDRLPEGWLRPSDDFLLVTTGVRPPAVEAGCQELVRPTPEPADLYVSGVAGQTPRNTVRVRVDNHGFGPVTLDWGDAAADVVVADGTTVEHTYSGTGPQTITATDVATPTVQATRAITIPLPPDEPSLALEAAPNTSGFGIVAEWDNHGNGPVLVDWGDASPETAGASTGTATHTYTNPGVYTVTVRDAHRPYRARREAAVPIPGAPTITVAEDPGDASGNTARLTVDNHGRGLTAVSWGDTTTSAGPATDGGTVSHAYTTPGTYTIRVWSVANPLSAAEDEITIPFP
ncbi:hypothetical protein [Bailinhaonella thermotolerans]|uniref:PKD domain-containing protein n=1 Tax=Bailinhaonella thermotolerans TaxID=1070861 RepID=A0A3A3ZXN7_9ACTN|nr:hypothetical protein [Bailinhaonella thermotolerans]RJL19339.1 hypothetical protein D5H75_40460 [Bailinhaonella thermotolerans]